MLKLRRTIALCGLLALAAVGSAKFGALDATISIDRALNSPTLTVKYTGAVASLVELRINGDSIATRSVAQDKDSGETNFTIDMASLRDGDNLVEVRLFDKNGRMIATEKTTITTDDGSPAPFFMDSPKMGQTVQGPIEISVGFNKNFTNSFVSFFIDNQLRAMTNTPPFTYTWDTAREANGWHELESWLVDDSNTTYRTKKIRIFVNNPGGHTNRQSSGVEPRKKAEPDVTPAANPSAKDGVTGSPAGPKPLDGKTAPTATPASPGITIPTTTLIPVTTLDLTPMANTSHGGMTGSAIGLKPAKAAASIATGPKLLTPTGTRFVAAVAPKIRQAPTAVEPIINAVHLIPITRGSRLPNLSTFAILMNGQFVDFDVTPRVDSGVPMTPLRFLFERDGGKVDWNGIDQTVTARAEGRDVFVKIGDTMAKVNESPIEMERAAYLESGRTIVPLSFIRDALNVNVQYDKATGHVLITSLDKK